MLAKSSKFFFGSHAKFAVIGGGTAGLNLSSQLFNAGVLKNDLTVFEPSKVHNYQPAWTLVAGGIYDSATTFKPTKDTFPKGTNIVNLAVKKVNPEKNEIITEDDDVHTYENLIVATGNVLDYAQIKGAPEALADPNCPVGSAYTKEYADKWAQITNRFSAGEMIFHEPQMPIKCGGAPQKVCFLTEYQLRQQGKRQNANISFYMAKGVCFGVPKYSAALEELHKEKHVELNLGQKIVEINKDARYVVYENTANGHKSQKQFDALHIVPPQLPPKFIAESGLADATGYVDVDKGTMQHKKYPNVWSLGDSSNLPTSKTAAAVFSQTPPLVHNVLQFANKGTEPYHIYDGYTSCPIPVGDNKLMLAEFKYDAVVDETFPTDQKVPKPFFFWLKKYFFPFAYWTFVPRGLWHGRKAFLPSIPLVDKLLGEPKKEGHHGA